MQRNEAYCVLLFIKSGIADENLCLTLRVTSQSLPWRRISSMRANPCANSSGGCWKTTRSSSSGSSLRFVISRSIFAFLYQQRLKKKGIGRPRPRRTPADTSDAQIESRHCLLHSDDDDARMHLSACCVGLVFVSLFFVVVLLASCEIAVGGRSLGGCIERASATVLPPHHGAPLRKRNCLAG